MSVPDRPSPGDLIGEEDADLAPLLDRTVTVLGYGTMGRAHALNLRDAGIRVVVGARRDSTRCEVARREGFPVEEPAAAVGAGDVVAMMLPDDAMAGVYRSVVAPALRPAAALAFAHGFAVAFGQVTPEPGRACFLAAPKGQGDALRAAVVAGGGLPGLLAVSDGSPPGTWALAAAYARAVGCLRGGGLATTFRDECVADQFGEQVVLCGGVVELLQAAFDTLVGRGYSAENAYFECVHELKIITDLLHRHGVDGMRRRISGTAAYGGLTRGPRVVDASVRATMGVILDEIESGRFAAEFLARHDDPQHGTAALAAREAASPLAAAGRALAARMRALDPVHRPDSEEEDQ
ncbi:MAG: ketol-acid reductoisomerase [Candidatus Krumholzibacteriia bacterium]